MSGVSVTLYAGRQSRICKKEADRFAVKINKSVVATNSCHMVGGMQLDKLVYYCH